MNKYIRVNNELIRMSPVRDLNPEHNEHEAWVIISTFGDKT